MKFHENSEYIKEILNKLYGTSSTAVQHRVYDISTGEPRSKNHEALAEAKYVHFSDRPMPRPWLDAKKDGTSISQSAEPCLTAIAIVQLSKHGWRFAGTSRRVESAYAGKFMMARRSTTKRERVDRGMNCCSYESVI
jgi:hypothetical protein